MVNKEKYQILSIDVVAFEQDDVIVTSLEENEVPDIITGA